MQVDDDAFDADGGGGDSEFDLAKLIRTTMVLIIVGNVVTRMVTVMIMINDCGDARDGGDNCNGYDGDDSYDGDDDDHDYGGYDNNNNELEILCTTLE